MNDVVPQFPWAEGDHLFASALNAAIANGPYMAASIVNVLSLGAKGDGVTNDTAAIQAVLNTYAGKATVFIPNTGSPYMCDTLNPPSNSDLLIHGTLMLRADTPAAGPGGFYTAVIAINNANNVVIGGVGTLDGNGSVQTVATTAATLSVFASVKVNVTGVTLQNAKNWNLNVTNSDTVNIDRVRMLGGASSNEFALQSTNCWLTNCYINGPATDGGFAFYLGCINSGAIGNVITNANGGIAIVNSPGAAPPCQGITISNNIIFNNLAHGCSISSPGVARIHSRITISNNIFFGNNSANLGGGTTYPCSDIWLSSCRDVVVSGNKISNSGNGSYPMYGIVVGGWGGYQACWAATVTGNDISNQGQGAATSIGIFLAPNQGNDILVSGNHVSDDQTTKTMLNGIAGTCGLRTAIIGNYLGTFIGSAVSITHLSDTVMANAFGGAWSIGSGALVASQAMVFANAASNIARWFVGNDATTESGGDTGNDFFVVRAHDNGSLIDTPLKISRATGSTTLSSLLTVGVMTSNTGVNIFATTLRTGTGAATGTQPKGSIFLRTDGGVGSTMYVSQGGGTWNAVAGV